MLHIMTQMISVVKVSVEGNKMESIYWTCGGVANLATMLIVTSQMDQTKEVK